MNKKRPDWAQRIKQARENKGISQREMVKRLGSNQTTLLTRKYYYSWQIIMILLTRFFVLVI